MVNLKSFLERKEIFNKLKGVKLQISYHIMFFKLVKQIFEVIFMDYGDLYGGKKIISIRI